MPTADLHARASPAARPPAQRLVRQPTDHGVARGALATAAPAPLVGFDDAAGQHCSIGFESLPDDSEAEAVESSEGGQIMPGEGRHHDGVRHVEVFQMSGVGAFIFGRPRPLPGHRRADRARDVDYTLIWEESDIGDTAISPEYGGRDIAPAGIRVALVSTFAEVDILYLVSGIMNSPGFRNANSIG
ncbi:hypothetical protein BJZ21_003615 [Nocardioides panaciterrulae]|uniref:Uncharacterized protein n=1 Tax=Nocardioides panaciterrulae TaxID=661492 RepID=A0A7Y9E9L2_9ACTN|nr:hypothetical protein [Nocardioides panaciterrulae]